MGSYIDAISQASTAATGKESSKSKDDAVMGKEDFLTLLVAQLKNQDPLNPDEPTEFTAQLAQFSSLEQLFTLNESMDNLVASNSSSDRFSTLNTIGKDVAYQSSSLDFNGDPVEFGYKLDEQASSVTVSLQLNGATVKTFNGDELSPGNHFITWDGLTEEGAKAPQGNYTIVVHAEATGEEGIGIAPLIRSEVTGVDLEGEPGGTLITKAGEVSFTSILGVYEKGSKIGSPQESVEEEEVEEPEIENNLAEAVTPAAELAEDTTELIN